MIDAKLALVNIITLLFFESKIRDANNSSAEICKKMLEAIRPPEDKLSISESKDELHALKATALYMVDFSQTEELDKDALLQRLAVNCTGDLDLYNSFVAILDRDYEINEIKKKIITIRHGLKQLDKEETITKTVKKAYQDLIWGREKIASLKIFTQNLVASLEVHHEVEEVNDPAVVAKVGLGDKTQMAKALQEMKKEQSSEGVLMTGWKAINDMLQGGFRRGEFWIIPALQHCYKTGFTLSLFKQIAKYNKPYMIDPTKKPLLLRISFEDTMSQNLRYMWENIRFNKTGEMPSLDGMDEDAIASEIIEELVVGGYQTMMLRVDASRWTYKDVFNYVLSLEASGYEIHLCVLDYLSLLPTTGCTEGPSGTALRDLYRRMRAFFSAKKITVLTPHQLSSEAKQLIRDGHTDFLNQVAGRGYFADSKQLDQEVDGELYLHKIKFNKRSFLWVKRHKHRGVPVIKEDLLDAYYPFPEVGPIIDDVDRHRIDLTRIGGQVKSEGVDQEAVVEEDMVF
jgi:hypothetical protein